jgi:hypothetical protein
MARRPRDALLGIWGQEYGDSWKPRFDSVFEAAAKVTLSVLVWGPGKGTTHYTKRQQIAESLADSATGVATPEALMEADPRFGDLQDTLLAEEIQAEAADIVIALAVDDRNASGVHVELSHFAGHPRIGPKLRLLAPLRPKTSGGPLILEAAARLPDPQRFDYTPTQYDDCEQMRAKVRRWVEEARRAKYLRALRAGPPYSS